jgi:hypothetical protein
MYKRVVATCAAGLIVFAACGGSDDTVSESATITEAPSAGESSTSATEATPDSTIPGQDVAADQLAAEAALLTLQDFPAGWSEVPAEDDDETTDALQRRVAACAGSSGDTLFDFPAKAQTGDFTNPDDDSSVAQTVAIAPSEDEAAAVVAGLTGSDTPTCLDDIYTEFFEAEADLPEGTSLSNLSVAPLNVTSVGDEVGALRVTATLDVSGLEIDVVTDQVVVRVGRSLAGLTFYSQQSPTSIDRIDEYLGLAAGRLSGEGSSPDNVDDADSATTTDGGSSGDESSGGLASVEKSGFVTYEAIGETWANVGALIKNNTDQDLFFVEVTYNFIGADGSPVATESSYLDVLPAADSMPTVGSTTTDLTPFMPVTVEVTAFADDESFFESDWVELEVNVPDPRILGDEYGLGTVSGTVTNNTANPTDFYQLVCLVSAPDGSVLGGVSAFPDTAAPGQTVAWEASGSGDFESFVAVGAAVTDCRALLTIN